SASLSPTEGRSFSKGRVSKDSGSPGLGCDFLSVSARTPGACPCGGAHGRYGREPQGLSGLPRNVERCRCRFANPDRSEERVCGSEMRAMTPERWKQIDELAQSALERGVADRGAFLDKGCLGDEALRREVESQIAYQQQASKFLEEPVFKHAAELIPDPQP